MRFAGLQRWGILAVFLAILATFLALITADTTSRTEFLHDEMISYLCATGNQGSYGRYAANGYFNTWIRVDAFGQLRNPDAGLDFKRVRDDLVHADIHPPLYFWTLHLWQWAFGRDLATLHALNTVISAVSIFVMFWFLTGCLGHDRVPLALGATGLFALSPNMAGPFASYIRQYELLQLLIIFSMIGWRGLMLNVGAPRLLWGGVILVSQTAALLTHTQFVLVIAASNFAALLIPAIRRKAFLPLFVLGAASVLFFLLLHPGFFEQLTRQRAQVAPFSGQDLAQRIVWSIRAVAQSFGLKWATTHLAGLALVLLAIVAAILGSVRSVRRGYALGLISTDQAFIGLTAITCAAMVFSLYFFYVTPTHAIGRHYALLYWPLVVAAIAVAVSALAPVWRYLSVGCLLLLVLSDDIRQFLHGGAQYQRQRQVAMMLHEADRAWINTGARGFLPGIILGMRGDALLYVDTGGTDSQRLQQLIAEYGPIDLFATTAIYKTEPKRVGAVRQAIESALGPPTHRYWNWTRAMQYDDYKK